MIKYVITTFICIVIMSCNFFDKNTQKYRKIALEFYLPDYLIKVFVVTHCIRF